MTAEVQTSFIPKQALTKEVRPLRREPFGLFSVLATVVLLVALIFLAGVYFWRAKLSRDIERPCPSANPGSTAGCGLVASIEAVRQSIEQKQIEIIEQFDKKLKRAGVILNNHRTFLPSFEFLEAETLQSIRYTSFNQTGASLNLRGSAANYEGIALQSIIFAADRRRVKDFVFSDLNADVGGRVAFNLKLDLDPQQLSYFEALSSELP